MQVIFWTEDNFCFTSDCKNSFNCKLKKLINEKIIIFYGPWNALCSAGKSRQIKQFKHHTFSGLCSLFPRFSLQIYNFFNEDTSNLQQIEQMCKYALSRSNRPEVFLRKGVLKICSKFRVEHSCRSAISIKLQIEFTLLHLYYSLFAWQVIGNAIIKHQRPYKYALVL